MSEEKSEITHTERTVLDRLNVRYSGLVRNGGWSGPKFLRAEHVPVGLRLQRHRICDYVATSMHSTPHVGGQRTAFPPVYHGHEVKVSRSDWLTELRDPTKAEAFRPHMHFWWLVAADKSIVRDDLPEGWGLLIPHGPRTLKVVVQATLNPDPEPMSHGLQGALLRAAVTTETRLSAAETRRAVVATFDPPAVPDTLNLPPEGMYRRGQQAAHGAALAVLPGISTPPGKSSGVES